MSEVVFKANTAYRGRINVGPSKSHLIRLLFCALLRQGLTEIKYEGTLPGDVVTMIGAISDIGASVALNEGSICVDSRSKLNQTATLNLNECGTAFAFFSVLNSFPGWNLKLNRSGTLLKRDYTFAHISFDANGNLIADGSKSSQAVSGAIMCASFLNRKREVYVRGELCSKGYVLMTSKVLESFGGEGKITMKAEPDATSISVVLAANFLGADFNTDGMKDVRIQPDRVAADMFDKDEVDLADNPDLVFTIAVIAAAKKGTTIIKNIGRLKNKESDRASGCVDFINSLGGNALFTGKDIEINGTGRLLGGKIDAKNDHRVVFGAFLASLISENDIIVTGAEEAVGKSWPDFIECISDSEASNDKI